jgi:hypothetical protein
MSTRDERALAELRFANHILDDAERAIKESDVRRVLGFCDVTVAQDIIDLGCTGVLSALLAYHAVYANDWLKIALQQTQGILENIGGSGTGLPCYVSPQHFCLIHNCVGALEPGQTGLDAHPGMIRDLIADEALHAKAMGALADQHAVEGLQEHFKAEVEKEDPTRPNEVGQIKRLVGPVDDYCVDLASIQMKPICSDHPDMPSLDCKACVAVAILTRKDLDSGNVQNVDGTTEHRYLAFVTRIEFLK